jgi:hypothetical protein
MTFYSLDRDRLIANNISFGATSPAANDTIIVEINVCSKEELDRILGSKMQLEGAGM